MVSTFLIAENYERMEIVVLSESIVASLILIIGTAVVRLIDQIVRLNKTKSEFVSVASHQLRTPISAIKWQTELLMTKFKKGFSDKQLESIENIALLSSRMSRLVNDLLDVARIDQNRLILKRQRMDLSKVVNDVLQESSVLIKSRNIELVYAPKKRLPLVFSDPEKMKLAVENLVSNSIKYTMKNGKIEIKLLKNNDKLIFEIKDNGVGIPEDQHFRVFEKFFRSDNEIKYQTEGTGLGLYITKNIVEQSGGKIWFQSIENVGSMFSFSMPIAKDDGKDIHNN